MGTFLPHPLRSLSVTLTTSNICFSTTPVYQRGFLHLLGLSSCCHSPGSSVPSVTRCPCTMQVSFLFRPLPAPAMPPWLRKINKWLLMNVVVTRFLSCVQASSQGTPGVAQCLQQHWPCLSVVNLIQKQFEHGAHSGPGSLAQVSLQIQLPRCDPAPDCCRWSVTSSQLPEVGAVFRHILQALGKT